MKLKDFTGEEKLTNLKDTELIKELQVALNTVPDGLIGENTIGAFADFKRKNYLTKPDVLGAGTATLLASKIVSPLIRKEQCERVFGRKISERQYNDLLLCLNTYKINTIPRIRHFLAQVAHESCGLKYSTEIASGAAYEGRLSLGNDRPGDGRKYKGGGYIQLTGKANYTRFAKSIKDPKVLELGAKYVGSMYPFTSAGFWWMNAGMNKIIDAGATVKQVSYRVNGGYNGLQDRINYYNKALTAL